jgi:hypothetical protein
VVEFAALRRLAPWYGQSVFTWANDVGVVLAFLALGSVLGGLLADRVRGTVSFYRVLQWSAFWLVLAATVAGDLVAGLLRPTLGEAGGALPIGFWESLAAAAICFGPPMVGLGTVSPFYVRRSTHGGDAGASAGRIAAASTVGSLAGCYLAPFWLLPVLGTRATLLVAAGAVGVVALWGYLADRVRLAPAAPGAGEPSRGEAEGAPSSLGAFHVVVAAAAGLATLVVEFASVRLWAPWFGQSNPVWANAVGVVLLSLALGYALGGRIADRTAGDRPLPWLLLGAAALTALPAFLGPAVGAALAPSDLAGDRALPMSFWGSLAATAALVGPPTVLLGAVAPVLVRAESAPGRRGRAAGKVFAAGTIGSLAGTYLAPLALIGTVGSRKTLLACSLLLVALAYVAGRRMRPRPSALVPGLAAATVGAAAAFALVPSTLRVDPGQVVEVETAYQTVRVREEPPPDLHATPPVLPTIRYLQFDEDVESYQSVLALGVEPEELTGGRYYDHLALAAWFDGMPWTSATPAAPRVLVVGYAGGTVHRVLDAVAPPGLEPTVHGVELDPRVVTLARQHLRLGDLETPRLTLFDDEDGRSVVESLGREPPYDLILVDAYQRTQYVPFQLATEEFFRACADRLAPSGVVGMNVMVEGGLSNPLLRSIATTLGRGLSSRDSAGGAGNARVFLVPNPWSDGNVTIWGTRGRVPRVSGRVPKSLYHPAFAFDALVARHVDRDDDLVLTDDRAPTEALADAALVPVAEPTR